MGIRTQLKQEIAIINRLFADHGVDAGTMPRITLVAGGLFIAYGVQLGRGVKVSAVTGLQRELSEAISSARRTPTAVRFRLLPLAIEVEHPEPAALDWRQAPTTTDTHSFLAGRSYDYNGAREETISLDEQPHILIAGFTGSGKSVLLTGGLISLLANTSPRDLACLVCDLKNTDLPPFRVAPHVRAFAGELEAAERLIAWMHEEMKRRIAGGDRTPRIVLVIDEVALLAKSKPTLERLEELLSIGRALALNVVAATQHPTAAALGSIAKANFTVRLVGQVTDATTASVATGRADSGAQFLPGRGAFLRVEGSTLRRFQSYYLTEDNVPAVLNWVRGRWGGVVPVRLNGLESKLQGASGAITAGIPGAVPASSGTNGASVPLSVPLPYREPGPAERAVLRRLYREQGSKNKTLRLAYEVGKTPKSLRWLDKAIAEGVTQ